MEKDNKYIEELEDDILIVKLNIHEINEEKDWLKKINWKKTADKNVKEGEKDNGKRE